MVCSKADDGQFIVLHGPNSPTAQIVLMGAPRSKRVSFKFLVNAATDILKKRISAACFFV